MNEIRVEQQHKHELKDLKKKKIMVHILMQKSKFYINTLGYTMFIVFYNLFLVINIFNNLNDLVLENV